MKKLLAILLLAIPLATQAATVTITVTASELNRLQVAVGEVKQLMDNQVPPQRRDATPTEVKQFFIERAKQLILDVEGAKLRKIADDAVVIPAFDPQ